MIHNTTGKLEPMQKKDVIARIKQIARWKHMTLADIASQLTSRTGTKGITQVALSQSLSDPSLERLIEIAKILDVSVSEFFKEDDAPIFGCVEAYGRTFHIHNIRDLRTLADYLDADLLLRTEPHK